MQIKEQLESLQINPEELSYLVEANTYEQLCILKEHGFDKFNEVRQGDFLCLGFIDDRPVNITLVYTLYIPEYKYIAFWEPVSQLVDYKLIEDFFDNYYGNIERSNTMNFKL